MERKKRLELNRIASCFKGFRGVTEWRLTGDKIIVYCAKGIYSAQNIYGTYGFVIRHE